MLWDAIRLLIRGDGAAGSSASSSPKGIEFVWQEGVRVIDGRLGEASALDGKASTLLGLTSASLALVVAQREQLGTELAGLLVVELSAVLVFLPLSFRTRRFERVPALPRLARWANADPGEIRVQFMGNPVSAYITNENALKQKALYLKAAAGVIMVLAVTLVIGFIAKVSA